MNQARILRRLIALSLSSTALGACSDLDPARSSAPEPSAAVISDDVDVMLQSRLARSGFTGRIASTLEPRLGRHLDRQLADLGRLLWFDPIQG